MTLYDELGINPDASEDEVRNAYRKKAQQTHPDKGGDERKFKVVKLAYEVLSDPERRQRYDETGEDERPQDERGMLLDAIAALVLSIIDQVDVEHTNVMQEAVKHVLQQKQQLTVQISQREGAVQKRERALKRIKRKREGHNIVSAMVEAEIAKQHLQIGEMRKGLTRCDLMLELIADYDYQVDARPQPVYASGFEAFTNILGQQGGWR